MRKLEFLEKLEKLLSDISYTERQEALKYYKQYFLDADEDQTEEQIVESLGSPEEVSRNIHEELADKEVAVIESVQEDNSSSYSEKNKTWEEYEHTEKDKGAAKSGRCIMGRFGDWIKTLEGWQIGLAIVLLVLTSPAWVGVISAVFGSIFGLICAAFGIVFGLGVGSVGVMIGGIALFVVAIAKFLAEPIVAAILIGTSILLIGISMLMFLACVKLVTVACPALWKLCVKFYEYLFVDQKVEVAA